MPYSAIVDLSVSGLLSKLSAWFMCYPYIVIRKCNYITVQKRRAFTFPICHTLYFLIDMFLYIGVTYSIYIGTKGDLAICMGIDLNRAQAV